MPALELPAPILYLSSEPSFFGIIDGDAKNPTLKDVTRIDFPLIEDGEFQKENLVHALKSLEQKKIYLVVSDEVFYHHISDYATSAQKNIEKEIKETVSEVFSDKKDPLHIVTVDLAKTSKMQTVQITALTKANLTTLAQAAKEADLEILSILPASFVVKAFVSVDPSLFVLITTNNFLVTSHYIGVDFAQNISKDNLKELVSTIKTLKTERPHIQHVYLCGDTEVVAPIHEELADVIPVQDVEVKNIDTEHDTPFFLRAFILGIKEVIENDFPLPHFSTDLDTSAKKESIVEPEADEEQEDPIKKVALELEKEKETKPVKKEEPEETIEEKPVEIVTPAISILPTPVVAKEKEPEEETPEEVDVKPSVSSVPEKATPKINITTIEPPTLPHPATTVAAAPVATAVAKTVQTPSPTAVPKLVAAPKIVMPSAVSHPPSVVEPAVVSPTLSVSPPKEVKTETVVDRSTIGSTVVKTKKKSGVFKYVCLALGVALVISLIGGGIVTSQQAILEKNAPLQTPISEVSTTPIQEEPTPTPKPTVAPVELEELTIGVFNATSVAGKAGKVAAAVKKEGAKTVDAGNAKGKYEEEGNFIMFAEPELEGAKATLEKATGLTLEELEMSKTENVGSKYDIIIILNE